MDRTGDTLQITAQAQDADGDAIEGLTYKWMSSDASVATVDQSGLVVALRMGTTVVSVSLGRTDSTGIHYRCR